MKLISLSGVQKERRVILTLEVILLIQFFELNMEKKVKMVMEFNTSLNAHLNIRDLMIKLLQMII